MPSFDATRGSVYVASGVIPTINADSLGAAQRPFNRSSFGDFAENPNGAIVGTTMSLIRPVPCSYL